MVNGKQAWALLAGGILLYEATCDEGQLLSEVVDHWLVTRPVTTRLAIIAVACHLLNVIPSRLDPIAKVGALRPHEPPR